MCIEGRDVFYFVVCKKNIASVLEIVILCFDDIGIKEHRNPKSRSLLMLPSVTGI